MGGSIKPIQLSQFKIDDDYSDRSLIWFDLTWLDDGWKSIFIESSWSRIIFFLLLGMIKQGYSVVDRVKRIIRHEIITSVIIPIELKRSSFQSTILDHYFCQGHFDLLLIFLATHKINTTLSNHKCSTRGVYFWMDFSLDMEIKLKLILIFARYTSDTMRYNRDRTDVCMRCEKDRTEVVVVVVVEK